MYLSDFIRSGALALTAAMIATGCSGQTDDDDFGTPTGAITQAPTNAQGTATVAPTPTNGACSTDLDGDSYIDAACAGGDDCNDANGSIHPGAPEGVDNPSDESPVLEGDGVDNDCDETIDEGTNLYDDDEDGYTELEGDCNDIAPAINPGAVELCDSVDNNCDNITDNRDADLDGYIDIACGGDDCADTRDDIYPGAAEGTDTNGDGIPDGDFEDNDCDTVIDEDTSSSDDDGDGYTEQQDDCDDYDALVYPGAIERFDDKDQNCDDDLTWGETAKSAPASVVSFVADTRAGTDMAGTHDVDGDTFHDLLIGAPGYDSSSGAAYLLKGRVSGWGDEMDLEDSARFSYPAGADRRGAEAGFSVAGVGDLNGDAIPDFVIGAPGYIANNNDAAGAIHVFTGQAADYADQDLENQVSSGGANSFGVTANVEFGYSLAGSPTTGACDVTGDGVNDLVIGGPWNQSTPIAGARGYLMIYPGRFGALDPEIGVADLTSYKGAQQEALGYAVACGGDIDYVDNLGLRITDLLIAGKGTDTNNGIAYMIPGSGNFASPGPKGGFPEGAVGWTGDGAQEFVGHSVSVLGNVNGDEYVDYGIGRRSRTPGQALGYVIYGSATSAGGSVEGTSTLRLTGDEADKCPCVLEGIGDFNDDGIPDMALSAADAPGSIGEAEAGRIWIFLGRAGGFGDVGTSLSTSTADYTFTGEYAGDRFGSSIAPAGDINDDGFDDFVVGAPNYDADDGTGPQANSGKIYIFFGFAE